VSQLQLTMIQSALVWEDRAANLRHFDALLGGMPATDLVLLPEMFSTGFSMRSDTLAEPMDGATMTWLASKAEQLNTVICTSFICEDGGQHFNRLIWMRPDHSHAFYDKRHLFWMADEHHHYEPGKKRLIVELNGFRICPMICYDLRFPVWCRNREDYDLLLFVANWPSPRVAHWQSLLNARAIENIAYVAGLNRVGADGHGIAHPGASLVYDFAGQCLLDMGNAAGVQSVTLDLQALGLYRQGFPAARDADPFTLSD